ncbi:M20/M25/M40 family metallo-hydrolase [Thalassotalea sp. LPB0316]|uniref:M20/M25/M40 family metallo-hydrolase n=1 Tax=Thalassotalea sp. LPB0316 TaxID=2769490 RepID=UPI001869424E|nr:M20/M25/M40 family metallo-hydrolase [Thalassotalea sp. LPB0316]QOL25101.1 M20/M25/M40 family metallo-hydrolase [Thalassotalea sp. LPB0316]
MGLGVNLWHKAWALSWVVVILSACSHYTPVKPVNYLVGNADNNISASVNLIDEQTLLADFETMSSPEFAGRKYGTLGNELAQQFIVSQLKAAGVAPFKGEYQHPFEYERGLTVYQGTNIIGVKPGSSGQIIVISAHFDHIGKKSGQYYLGADDNASGTTAVLHIAKAFEQVATQHTLIYLFTDAEEENLIGARAFAEQNPQVMATTALNVNLDMISGAKYTKRLYYLPYKVEQVAPKYWQGQLAYFAMQHQLSVRKGPRAYQTIQGQKKKTNWRSASDHGVFYRYKVPFLYFGVGTHQNYHTPQDTFDNTNHDFYLAAVKTIFDQVLTLEQQIE